MYVVEENADFAARHGGNELYVDGRMLFPDGAVLIASGLTRGDKTIYQRYEPPTDAVELLKARQTYLYAKIRKLTDARNNFARECMVQASHYAKGCSPPPPRNWEQQLKEGAEGIAAVVYEAAVIQHELAKYPQAVDPGRVFAEQQAQKHKEAQELIRAIHAASAEPAPKPTAAEPSPGTEPAAPLAAVTPPAATPPALPPQTKSRPAAKMKQTT